MAIAEMVDNAIQAGAKTVEISVGGTQQEQHPLSISISDDGHGMGPSIDFRSAGRGEATSKPLVEGSYISIELNTRTTVPEWDGQDVHIMQEDPAYLTPEGWVFFRPRQEEFYLITSVLR